MTEVKENSFLERFIAFFINIINLECSPRRDGVPQTYDIMPITFEHKCI